MRLRTMIEKEIKKKKTNEFLKTIHFDLCKVLALHSTLTHTQQIVFCARQYKIPLLCGKSLTLDFEFEL